MTKHFLILSHLIDLGCGDSDSKGWMANLKEIASFVINGHNDSGQHRQFKIKVNAFALGGVSSEEFNPVMWLCEGL